MYRGDKTRRVVQKSFRMCTVRRRNGESSRMGCFPEPQSSNMRARMAACRVLCKLEASESRMSPGVMIIRQGYCPNSEVDSQFAGCSNNTHTFRAFLIQAVRPNKSLQPFGIAMVTSNSLQHHIGCEVELSNCDILDGQLTSLVYFWIP